MALRHPVGVQLYSGRKFPPLDTQLAVVAHFGFTHVETFGRMNEQAAETRRLLDRHGLAAISAHVSLDEIESDTGGVVRAARALGVEFVVAPYLSPERRPNDRAGWVSLGERLARSRDAFAREGLRFAWHNHDFEFEPLPDGAFPIEHVLGADLAWEADLAWVTLAGADPLCVDRALSRPHPARPCQGRRADRRQTGRGRLGGCRRRRAAVARVVARLRRGRRGDHDRRARQSERLRPIRENQRHGHEGVVASWGVMSRGVVVGRHKPAS